MARKTKQFFREEHQVFLKALQEGFPSLEIMKSLGLSRPQFKTHLLVAYQSGEIKQGEYEAKYELVRLNSLPDTLQAMLVRLLPEQGGKNALIKAEVKENGIFLSSHGDITS